MKKLRFLAVFSVIMLSLQGLYAQYTGQQNFSLAEVSTTQTDGWDIASLVGCNMEADAGKPYLPVKHLHIVIPGDKDVTGILILGMQQQELTGNYNIMPTQLEQIPGEAVPEFVNPDPTIYNMNAQYPTEYIYSPTAGFKSGVHIAEVLYYPLRYNPITRKLYLTTQIQYQLVFADANHNPVKPRRMNYSTYLKLKNNLYEYQVS